MRVGEHLTKKWVLGLVASGSNGRERKPGKCGKEGEWMEGNKTRIDN